MARGRDRDDDGGCQLDAGLDSKSRGIRVEQLAGKASSVTDAVTNPDPRSDSKPNPATDDEADPAAGAETGSDASAHRRTGSSSYPAGSVS